MGKKKAKIKNKALTYQSLGFDDSIIDVLRDNQSEMSEVTYYTCIKMLSEAIAKLPLKFYQMTPGGIVPAGMTDTFRVLSLRPNPYMTPTTFWTTMEMNCQHYGNAFAWIDGEIEKDGKYGGKYVVHGLYPMDPKSVSILVDNVGLFGTDGALYYKYTNPRTGKEYLYRDSEVLHFKTWYSFDGITGEPVRRILKDVIGGASSSASYQNNLFRNGLTASMVVQYAGNLGDEQIKALKSKMASLTGPKAAGKVIPIPMGLTLTPLNMSMVDADFCNLRKYSALQIAAAFGIKPGQLNSYENSKYASSEYEALVFLNDTLSYRIKMYEEEINAKMLTPSEYKEGYFYKFNEKAILRTDAKTQSEVLKNYTQGGIYTSNEARQKLDLPNAEGGDVLLVNGSYVPIQEAGAAYNGGIKDGNTKN